MQFLKFSNFASPTEFVFHDPDTNFRYEAKSFNDLLFHIQNYRAQNDLSPIEELPIVLEHYLCKRSAHLGACEPRGELRRGLFPTIRGGIAMLQNVLFKSFAPQEVADKRSEICASCSLNVFPDKGPFIEWSDNLALHTIGERRSKHHDELGNCAGCTCPLRPKVFYDGKIKLTDEEAAKMEAANPACWQVDELKKERGV